jgi:hypothetical protein
MKIYLGLTNTFVSISYVQLIQMQKNIEES